MCGRKFMRAELFAFNVKILLFCGICSQIVEINSVLIFFFFFSLSLCCQITIIKVNWHLSIEICVAWITIGYDFVIYTNINYVTFNVYCALHTNLLHISRTSWIFGRIITRVARYQFGGPGVDIFIFFRLVQRCHWSRCCHAGECVLKAYESARARGKQCLRRRCEGTLCPSRVWRVTRRYVIATCIINSESFYPRRSSL